MKRSLCSFEVIVIDELKCDLERMLIYVKTVLQDRVQLLNKTSNVGMTFGQLNFVNNRLDDIDRATKKAIEIWQKRKM